MGCVPDPLRRLSVLLGAFAFLGPGGTPARAQIAPKIPLQWAWAALGVDLDVEVRSFPIHGRTLQEARRHLAAVGPIDDDGTRGEALTSYQVGVTWATAPDRDGCRILRVRTHAQIVIDLPEWSGAAGASQGDAEAWGTQSRELLAHEGKHRDEVLRAAYLLVDHLMDQRSDDCVALTRRVRGLVEGAKDELDEIQDRIDALRKAARHLKRPGGSGPGAFRPEGDPGSLS